MTVTLGLFNLFLFTIVITMTLTEFNLAAGFALFALLSIISLRSVNIAKIQVGYLLGAMTLGLVNGISIHNYYLLTLINLVIIVGSWLIDAKWLLGHNLQVEVTLENISVANLKDHKGLINRVQESHEMTVTHLEINKYNPKKQTVQVSVRMSLREGGGV
ncbi:MAG: hypothetical protein ACI8ZB_002785 [Desulforhopalus sp.]|jgi:hypothetical protein